jgi:hypothetical protein
VVIIINARASKSWCPVAGPTGTTAGALMSPSVNERESVWDIPLPAAQDKVSYDNDHLIPDGSLTFQSVWVEAMDIKMSSIWRILTLGKAEALNEQSNTGGAQWTQ